MPEDQKLELPTEGNQIPGPIINVETESLDPSVKLDPSIGDQIALTHIPDTEALIERYGGIFTPVLVESGHKWFIEKREAGEVNSSNERFLAARRDFPFQEFVYPKQKLGEMYALRSNDKNYNIWDLNITDSQDDKCKEVIQNGIRRMKQSVGQDSRNLLDINVVLPSGEEINISLISYALTGSYIYDGLTARHPSIRR